LNSFRYLAHALEYEIERQIGVLESGGAITQETRLWNVAGGRTEPMRSKEFAHDYRYFPDPDMLSVLVSEQFVADVRGAMAELPDAKRSRFEREYGITPYDAGVLTATRALADYTELLRRLNEAGKEIEMCPIEPAALAELLAKMDSGEITVATGKKVFATMFDTGKSATAIIASEGLAQITDASALEALARAVVAKSPDNAAKYRAGNEGVFKFFVGQVMRETRGQADPQLVNEILKRVLSEL
jgi:aspartyl-tRNA(Asn)/glutamyl-tRNA(Gln) amidotransferase subunit B